MFFKNVQSMQDLKSQYKKLARVHHPDCGGDTQNMQALNNEFDALFIIYKKGEEASQKFTSEFYTSKSLLKLISNS